MQRIYLDHNATTPLHPEVREAMLPYMMEHFGNGSSIHAYGREARNAIDTAREQVADLIGAKSPSEVVFTSCGTESDNYAIKGLAALQKSRSGNNHIITSSVEHHAVLHTCQHLEKYGFEGDLFAGRPLRAGSHQRFVRSSPRHDNPNFDNAC